MIKDSLILLGLLCPIFALTKEPPERSILGLRTSDQIKIDRLLNKPAWATNISVSGFNNPQHNLSLRLVYYRDYQQMRNML